MIGTAEREIENSVLSAQLNDDDDDFSGDL